MQRQAKQIERGKRRAESGSKRRAAPVPSAFRFPPSAFPHGLTLIELLVTIVIMVTVLAGVIPLMSPNNNARKIREASRQLSSMLAQAQAQAARDGRPAGVAFREFESGTTRNGVALEAFMINEPAPFAGFSDNSQVRLMFQADSVTQLQFVLGGGLVADPATTPESCYAPDPVPPETIRLGDVVSVGGFEFRITDPDRDGDGAADTNNGTEEEPDFKTGDFYTDSRADFKCTFIGASIFVPRISVPDRTGQAGYGWANPKAYRVLRQPRNTSDAPLQFPRGIGIDMDASGAVGTGPGIPDDFDDDEVTEVADVVGVMFNANGTLEGLYFNGTRAEGVSQVFMLMGAVENANNGSQDEADYDFKNNRVLDRDNLAQRRSRINWLNADSRWVAVGRSGRVVTSENNIFDPTLPQFTTNPPLDPAPPSEARQQKARQINAARSYAEQMQTEGGR